MYPILVPNTIALVALLATLGAFPMVASAEDSSEPSGVVPAPAARALSIKGARKEQKRSSMVGFTKTTVYYTLEKEKAVIALYIDNATAAFATTGKVFLFDPDATEKGIAKWVNNQHSDGLFADPAKPVATVTLPEGSCTITARELVGQKKGPRDASLYSDYKVQVAVKAHQEPAQFKLEAFHDEAGVWLKTEAL